MKGDPLEHEVVELLERVNGDITNLILEYGVPVPRIEAWVDDAIETAEVLSLKETGPERPARTLPATKRERGDA
jgi:hypothetical protein